VVYSTRLGAVTEHERRIAALPDTELVEAALRTEAEFIANAAAADVVIVGAVEPVTREVLAGLPRCKAVVRRGVGQDNVDVPAATDLGIIVANVPDASIEEVSDHALALALALIRSIGPLDRAVHDGRWSSAPAELGPIRAGLRRFNRMTLGVVGAGRIGMAMADKGHGIFGRVIASDPVVPAEVIAAHGAEPVELDDLLAQADIISLHAPLLPSTQHLIGPRTLALMKPGAIIVNTSRGQLVDQVALLEALERGAIAGAGLDVTDPEPLPADHPLLSHPRVIVTAHSAALSDTSAAELRRRSSDAAIAVIEGTLPQGIVNPDVLRSAALRANIQPGSES
jgi:D-3-phosphoglycerate dehydrogenase